MKKILATIFLTLIIWQQQSFAQNIANYNRLAGSNESLVEDASGWTSLIPANTQGVSSVTNIGFDVWFMGQRFTQFSVNTNGVIRFGSTVIIIGANTAGIAGQSRLAVYASANADVQKWKTNAGDGAVQYKITGTAPNRVLVVDWKNMLMHGDDIGTGISRFQAHIFETAPNNISGGEIKYVYGRMQILEGRLTTDGLGGPTLCNNGVQSRVGIGSGTATTEVVHLNSPAHPSTTGNFGGTATSNGFCFPSPTPTGAFNIPLNSTTNPNRKFYRFVSAQPNGVVSNLNVSCASTTSLNLTWTENATNEVGIVIFRSTDGINYSFHTQLAANATSYTDTGLTTGATYYYRVYTLTEGYLSNLSGTGSDSEIVSSTPVAVCQNVTVNLNATGNATVTAAQVNNGSSAGCGASITSLALSQTAFTCANLGANAVTLTVTNSNGATATCNATVTVVDNTAPVFTTCIGNQSIAVNAACQYVLPNYVGLVTATDNCTPTITQSPAAGTTQTGAITVTLTASDGTNSATCVFNTVPNDVTIPTFTVCPPNQALTVASGSCTASLISYVSLATATDNCGTTTITQSPAVGTALNVGTHTITLTATDGSNNTNTCTFNVVVTDTQLPTIVCPANISQTIAGVSTNITFGAATTSDNCAVASVVYTPASGSSFPVGVTNVNALITDVNGNTATCSFTVTITSIAVPPPSSGTLPNYPSYLIVEGQDTKTLKLRFPDSETNEDGYEIFRSIDGTSWLFHVLAPPCTVSTEVVHYDSINTEADQRYFYVVRTLKAGRRSGFTNSAYDYTYPHKPTVSILQTACTNGVGKIKAVGTHESNKYRWYLGADATEAVKNDIGDSFDEPIFTTNQINASYTYYVTAKGKKYESKPRVAIIMPVIARPSIVVVGGLAQRACGKEITLAIEPITGASYLWALNGVVIPGSNSPTFTASQNGFYQVLVNNGSCETGSNLINVAVNYKPKAIIKQGKVITFCQSGVISAKAESTVAYEWYKDDVLVGSGVDFTASSSGIYVLKAIENGCENTAEIKVVVNAFPTIVHLDAENETLCQGKSVVLTTDAIVGATYNWYRNDRLVASTLVPNLSVKKGGEYRVVPSYDENCGKSSAVVLINEIRQINLTQTFDGLLLTVNVPSGASTSSVTWTIDGEPAPVLNNLLSFKPTKNGLYELTVVWNNGCESKMKTNIILGTLGVEEENEQANEVNLALYPNPTHGKLYVNFGKAPKSNVNVMITDNLGRIHTNNLVKFDGLKMEIDFSALSEGLYILTLTFDGQEKVYKIVKD